MKTPGYTLIVELDYINFQYFVEPTSYYAYDPEKKCKTGDLVLIKELPEKKSTLITHEVLRIVFPLGDVTDPVTGRKVMNLRRDTPVYRYL